MEEKPYLLVEELLTEANALISKINIKPPLRKASPAVDLRTLRYFISLGLVPPPYAPKLWMPARYYNYEHLVKIIATRRLQEQGYSLAGAKTLLATMTFENVIKTANFDPALSSLKPLATQARKTPVRAKASIQASSQISLKLAKGVTLVVEGRTLSEHDLENIEEAAKALLTALPRAEKREEK